MGGSDRVQSDHAGVGLLHSVGLLLPFLVGLGFDREFGRINQTVAPQATDARPDVPHGGHGILELAGLARSDLRAHLHHGNEVTGERARSQRVWRASSRRPGR